MEIDLLIVDEYDNVIINPSIRMLSPYRELFAADKGEKGDHDGRKKTRSMKELAWVFHMCDPRSNMYRRYRDNKERNLHVKDRLGLPDNWAPSDLLVKVGDQYQKDIHSIYLELLESTSNSIVDLKSYYDTIASKMNDPKFDVAKYQQSVRGLQDLIKGVEDLKKQVLAGIYEKSDLKGGGEIGYFEE